MTSQQTASTTATRIAASTGQTTASTERTDDKTPSIVANTGLATPAVVADESARSLVVASCVEAAMPPPAMIASDQRQNGSTFVMASAETNTPARTAAGPAMESSRLSTNGM